MKEETNEVTLIMDRNIGDNVAWISGEDYTTANTDSTSCGNTSCNDEGPVTALNERTSGWTNITEKTWTVSGMGISTSGTQEQMYEDMTVTGRSRMLTYEEAPDLGCTYGRGSCPSWLYQNLYNTGSNTDDSENTRDGYWTTTPVAANPNYAWNVFCNGSVNYRNVYTSDSNGLRPVIELSK